MCNNHIALPISLKTIALTVFFIMIETFVKCSLLPKKCKLRYIHSVWICRIPKFHCNQTHKLHFYERKARPFCSTLVLCWFDFEEPSQYDWNNVKKTLNPSIHKQIIFETCSVPFIHFFFCIQWGASLTRIIPVLYIVVREFRYPHVCDASLDCRFPMWGASALLLRQMGASFGAFLRTLTLVD